VLEGLLGYDAAKVDALAEAGIVETAEAAAA